MLMEQMDQQLVLSFSADALTKELDFLGKSAESLLHTLSSQTHYYFSYTAFSFECSMH